MQQCENCARSGWLDYKRICRKAHIMHFLQNLLNFITLGFVGPHEYQCPYRKETSIQIRGQHITWNGPIYCRHVIHPMKPVDTGRLHNTHNLLIKRCGKCDRWLPVAGISCQGRCFMTSGFCLKERKIKQYQDSCQSEDEEE